MNNGSGSDDESDSSSDLSIPIQQELVPDPFLADKSADGDKAHDDEEEGPEGEPSDRSEDGSDDEEDQVDVGCLNEPRITRTNAGSGRELTAEEWGIARDRIISYRQKLPTTRCYYE